MNVPVIEDELYYLVSRYFGVIDMMFTGWQREDFLHCPVEDFSKFHQTQRKKIVKRILNYDPFLSLELKRRGLEPLEMADYMLQLFQLQSRICRTHKLPLWEKLGCERKT